MIKSIRTFMYLMTMLAVILMSANPSYTVFAEGGEGDPPPDEVPVTDPADPAVEETEPDPPAAESAPPPPEEPPAEAESDETLPEAAAEGTPTASEGQEPVSLPEILEQVPEGTDLIVINEEGDPEPLASQAAAETLIEGDPIWCPAGQAPTPGNNGCTPSQTGFDDLIAVLGAGTYSGDGVIWVESTYDRNQDSADIDFRNDAPGLPLLGDLTIMGGWDGVSGSTSVDPNNPSILDDRLQIYNWTGDVSVSNLEINAGARHTLLISNDGDISVDNVSVTGSTSGSGAFLDNCGEFDFPCTRSGDVTVTNSDFSGNTGQGLIVHSGGQVEISDTTANNNSANGILVNGHDTPGSNLTIENTTATGNALDGINASNFRGDVVLQDLTTNDNNSEGVSIDDVHGDISVTNLTSNNSVSQEGLQVTNTDGNLTISGSTISGNFSDGILVSLLSENLTIENTDITNNLQSGIEVVRAQGDVSVEGTTMSTNTVNGMNVDGALGNVTLKNNTANSNGENGIRIDDTIGSVSGSGLTANLNGSRGTIVWDTSGDVKLSNGESNQNTLEGLSILRNRSDVVITNYTASDSTDREGIDIHDTNGNLKLGNVTAERNNLDGIEIVNVDGSLSLYCIQTSENNDDGIYIEIDHDFYLKCSQSTNNGDDGVEIVLAPTAQLLSFTANGNTGQDINYNPGVTTVTEKKVDCSGKKQESTGNKGPWTKLHCLPGEIKVALYDTYGDKVEYENLCGYDAGVFDHSTWVLPEDIPNGGEEYILSLQQKMLEEIPGLEAITKYGLPGIIAQVLDELPFMLPEEFSYASGFFTAVVDEGEELVDPLPEEAGLTVRFRVPQWLDPDEQLTILWWDGIDWVDLGGEYSEDGYYFQVTTEETGVFVLAAYEIES